DLMRNQGLIWASDRAEWRLRRLKRRAGRAGVFNYRSALWDGSPKLPVKTRFDGVLIDAPCSGTGTWQRNPHARWTLTPEDLKELSQLQLRLLKHAASALKPGGKLVYSVCSLARSESLEVIEAFSGGTPDLCPLKFRNPLTPQANEDSQLWLYPQDFGGNGMFVACWRRTAEQKSA
ncbi:MAG TPA: RsmB/NOP family class I SAM-dependent RNA methyltransferase, partial [Verrucomicrobiae bacterium]|nr:RsmB/NOP family class I SAM-dependent RNA methyltransferase [Verrucomicrobiae bacterium]